MGRTHRTEWVQGPAGRIRVKYAGTGEPAVLFIHSLGGTHRQWASQLEHFGSTRRSVALDLRGHGDSAVGTEDGYALAALAGDIEAVREELELGQVILVGHSFGAGVATVYAGSHPDRVAGLLLADPIGEQREAEDELWQFIFDLRSSYERTLAEYWDSILVGANEAVREQVLTDLGKASPQAVIKSLEGTVEFDPKEEFGRFNGRTLVIRTPMNDFPYSLHNVVEGIPVEVITGTSHWLQMDRPSEFNALLAEFIRAVDLK